jgi:hypothetical protein
MFCVFACPWSQAIEHLADDRAILLILRRILLRRVEVFLEARGEKPVVVDVPVLAVPRENLRARVKDGASLPRKLLSDFGAAAGAGAAGLGSGAGAGGAPGESGTWE